MSVERADAEYEFSTKEIVKPPVTRNRHVKDIQAALTERHFKRFLKLNPEGHQIVFSTAFLDIVEDPKREDLELINDYWRWFSEGGDIESIVKESGTKPEKLEDLIGVMPAMLGNFYVNRKTVGSVSLYDTVSVSFKKPIPKPLKINGGDTTQPDEPTSLDPTNSQIPNLATIYPINEQAKEIIEHATEESLETPGEDDYEVKLPRLTLVPAVSEESEDDMQKIQRAKDMDIVDLDAPTLPAVKPEDKLKAMVAASKGPVTPRNKRYTAKVETAGVGKNMSVKDIVLEPLLSAEQRTAYAHVDVFNVALRPGIVSRNELMGAINSIWGRAIDTNVMGMREVDYLRGRFVGRPGDIELELGEKNPLKTLEGIASAYPGRLADEKLPNIRVIRSVLKQFAMGKNIYELKEMFPGAPVPLLLAGGISEVFRARQKAVAR